MIITETKTYKIDNEKMKKVWLENLNDNDIAPADYPFTEWVKDFCNEGELDFLYDYMEDYSGWNVTQTYNINYENAE